MTRSEPPADTGKSTNAMSRGSAALHRADPVTTPAPAPDGRSAVLGRLHFLIIGLVGAGIGGLASWIPSIWTDEAATISAATRSWSDLWTLVRHVDLVHAAYYTLMHVWFDLFGVSALTLRLPSALAVGVGAAGTAVLAQRLHGRPAALCAAVVFAVLPRVTWAGTEGRSSAITAAVAVWLTVLFVAAWRRNSVGWWAAYAIAGSLATITWLYLLLLVVTHGLTLLWSHADRRTIRGFLIAAAVTVVLVLPFALAAKKQDGQVSWITRPGPGVIKDLMVNQFFGTDGWIGVPLALLCWGLVAITGRRAIEQRAGRTELTVLSRLALLWIVVPPLLLIAYSIVGSPLYTPKYLTFCTPAVALAVGVAVAQLRVRRYAVAVMMLLVVLAAPAYVLERTPAAKDNSDWKVAAGIVGSNKQPGDVVLFGNLRNASGNSRGTARAVAYAYPTDFAGVQDLEAQLNPPAPSTVFGNSQPFALDASSLRSKKRVWVLYDHSQHLATASTTDRNALTEAGLSLRQQWPGSKVDVLLFIPA